MQGKILCYIGNKQVLCLSNVITHVGRTALARALHSAVYININRMQFGAGDGHWVTPPAPDPGRTSLMSVIKTYPTTNVFLTSLGNPTTTPTNIIRISTTIPEADVLTIREMGLLLADGTLLAYRTCAPIEKSTEFLMVFHWVLELV